MNTTWNDYGIDVPAGASGEVRTICPQCSPHRKPGHQRIKDLACNLEKGQHGKIGGTEYRDAVAVLETPDGASPKGLASMHDHSIPCTTQQATESLSRTRAEAKALGALHYFTGKPCPMGHIAPRFTSNYGCVECLRLHCQTYHERHKDRENERCREYAKRDPEGNRRRSNRWFEQNREKVLAAYRERHAANPEKRRRESLEWYYANPDKARAQRRLRKARLRGAGGSVTADEWQDILNRYGHKCLRCGAVDVPLTMDHVIPIVKGGTHTADNVQPLCGPCNQRKYTDTTDYREGGQS